MVLCAKTEPVPKTYLEQHIYFPINLYSLYLKKELELFRNESFQSIWKSVTNTQRHRQYPKILFFNFD